MPKDFTSSTFSEVYKDDYTDSAGYHRILFNSGRPIQARELTQLQTILQEQITRFADNIFLDGAAVSTAGAGVSEVAYFISETLPSGVSAKDYIGTTLQGPVTSYTSGLQFLIVHADDATNDGDFPTFYGTYVSYNQSSINNDDQDQELVFAEADVLQDIKVISGQEGMGDLTVRTQPGPSVLSSTGYGLLFGNQSANFYTQGHFVLAPKQLITISKYDNLADVDVGFEIIQDIVTVDDTDDLYDNQGAVPNLSSPGADRYRIRLNLTTRNSVSDPYKFVFFASVRQGEITQVKGGGSSYNEIEKRMAVRHFDTNGNFIVNPWEINFETGDNRDTLKLKVSGNVKGLNPTAFVDGYRLVKYNNETITINKPKSYTEEEGQSLTVDYRNYNNVAYDSADTHMGEWTTGFDIPTQKKMALIDPNQPSGQEVIGNGRIKHIVNTLDDSEGYRIHWYDVKMKDGKNARDVQAFAPHDELGSMVPINQSSGQMYFTEPEINTSLHEITGGRVKSINNAVFTVQRQFTATSSAGRTLQITTQSNESFDDKSRWVFINTDTMTEERVAPGDISFNSSSPQTAFCLVDGASQNYIVYAYVQKNAPTQKSKTFTYHETSPISATLQDDSDGKRFVFDLYDGVRLLSATADSAGGRDISDQVKFDGGQRDNYYGPVTLRPTSLPSSVTEIHAKFEYFTWGSTGDYFSVNSYVLTSAFGYSNIPTFQSPRDGREYDLRNHVDFRPKLDPYANDMSASDRFETPRDGDNFIYDVQWYNERIDHIAVGYDGNDFSTEIRVNQGEEAIQPMDPDTKNNELVLYRVEYGANTLNARDLTATRVRHKRYRMQDIDKLAGQVKTLEETVSLSFLEQEAANLVELDGNGDVRSKTGFFVDDFKGGFNLTASSIGPTWQPDDFLVSQELAPANEERTSFSIQPKSMTEDIQMLFDSDNKYGARTNTAKGSVVRKGDIVLLDYREVLDSSMVNEMISWYSDGRSSEEQGWYNVNPFNVFTGVGMMEAKPASDIWHDDYHLPDINIITETETQKLPPNYPPKSGNGSYQYAGKSVIETITVDEIQEDALAYAVPWSRQREIFFKCQGLRPNTRYWPFFDEINVEQWSIAETETEHKEHLRKNDHLRSYNDVDVTIRKHPRKTSNQDSVLISDYKGDLFFSFWLPNNAPMPSPEANTINSYEEFEQWVEEQERQAALYENSKDPAVMDATGWKFRSGTMEMVLNDVSVPNIQDGLSHARTFYVSDGSINVQQKTIYSTRTITEQHQYVWINSDPLAQSFTVSGRNGIPGVFLTKVDVFMRRAPQTANRGGTDLAIPLQLQIREVESGVPKSSPPNTQFVKYKPADEVYDVVNNISNLEDLDDVLSNPVTFELDEPVFLQANEEYAIVLLAECDDYEAFVSTTYGLVLGKTEERVSSQPATGSLFLSQNGSTWTPRQDQNMAYRIYTAKFRQEGSFNFYNSNYTRHQHNNELMSVDSDDFGRFRVNQLAHGLGVGDRVGLTGLDSGSTYLGLVGSAIMDSNLVVDSADTGGYFVRLDSGNAFTEAGWFGADSAMSNQSMYFDMAVFDNEVQNFAKTSVDYTASFISGVSYAGINTTAASDPRFDHSDRNLAMKSKQPIHFGTPKMLAGPDQEVDAISPKGVFSPSIVIGTKLKTGTVSTFGGTSAKQISNLGYVSDVSPIVDLQRASLIIDNFIIDNQPIDSSGQSELTNTPHFYVKETNPVFGSSPSKHITKPVVLQQAANGIRIFVDMYRPEASTVDLYYRTAEDPDANIYEVEWIRITPENNPPANNYSPESHDIFNLPYREYTYLAGGVDGDLSDFTKFQVKAVMKSTNTSEVPAIKSIRAIAVI